MFSLTPDCQNLIVIDLEWNQRSYNPDPRMSSEIIEIGACRVDRNYQIVDTFSEVIRPRVYKKLERHVKNVTGITEEELDMGRPFKEVYGRFLEWCGHDLQLITWGTSDFPVLQENAQFHKLPLPFAPALDAQMVFSIACLHEDHQQMRLHNALEAMNIEPDVPAHRAVYDAECTARLLEPISRHMSELNDEQKKHIRVLHDREIRSSLAQPRIEYTRYQSHNLLLKDRTLTAAKCPECHKKMECEMPWFFHNKKYLSLASCEEHGLFFCQMNIRRIPSGTLSMQHKIYLADEEQITDVHEKYEAFLAAGEARERRRQEAAAQAAAQEEAAAQ